MSVKTGRELQYRCISVAIRRAGQVARWQKVRAMAVVRLICGFLAGMICSCVVAICVAVVYPLPDPSVPGFGFPKVARDVPVAAANSLRGGADPADDACLPGAVCGSVAALPARLQQLPSLERDESPEPPDSHLLSDPDLMTP